MLTVGFVLSTRRAGSTWLGAVLGAHAGVANLGEYARPFLDRSHVACRLCEANGLDRCTRLHGIEHVAIEDAYAFAGERLGASTLIETSKSLDWPTHFMRQDRLDVRFVHLVRNPCGYVESELRRRPGTDTAVLIDEWVEWNTSIEKLSAESGRPTILVSYELLADSPAKHFPALCEFLGFSFEPAALQYWTVEHHGLGGNGANSLYLRNRKVVRYITGDDAYYEKLIDRPTAADVRWRERVPAEVRNAAVSVPYAHRIAAQLGVTW